MVGGWWMDRWVDEWMNGWADGQTAAAAAKVPMGPASRSPFLNYQNTSYRSLSPDQVLRAGTSTTVISARVAPPAALRL